MGKGILAMQIAIDYDEMLSEDKLKAISDYMGLPSATVEDIIKMHMNSLGKKLESVIKDMPLVQYRIDGRLLEEENTEQSLDKEYVDDSNLEKSESLTKEESIELDNESSNTNNNLSIESMKKLIEYLEEDLEHVGAELGIPIAIKVNYNMRQALEYCKNISDRTVTTENSKVTYFKGFKVVDEGMEEPYYIEYKDYVTGEVLKAYSEKYKDTVS